MPRGRSDASVQYVSGNLELDHRSDSGVIDCLRSVSEFILDVNIANDVSRLESTHETITSGFGESFEILLLASGDPFRDTGLHLRSSMRARVSVVWLLT